MSIILQIWDNFHMISLQVLNKKKEIARRKYQDSRFPTVQHNHGYWGTFRKYSGIFWTLCNPGIFKIRSIFRTLAYPKLWDIQKQIFRILGYSEPEASSEPCQTSAMECFDKQLTAIIILVSYNYCQCKKVWRSWSRAPGPWSLIYLFEVLQWYYLLLLTFNIF